MFLPRKTVPAKRPDLLESIGKLAMAGERAGFTIEEMINLLNAGMTLKALVDLITERLNRMGLVHSDSVPKEYHA